MFVSREFVFSTVDLVGLLRWRSQRHNLQTVLTSLLKIDGEEIVKVSQIEKQYNYISLVEFF